MPTGYIIVNKMTLNPKTGANHGKVLEALGYTVNLNEDTEHFEIECEGFVEDATIDLTLSPEEVKAQVQDLVQAKKLWTYACSVKARKADGQITTLPGVHGARYLNQVFPGGSALVAKSKLSARKKVDSTFSIADILG